MSQTYGIKAINESQYDHAMSEFEKDGGCRDQLLDCQAAVREYDPESRGRNATVNLICVKANECSGRAMAVPYLDTANACFTLPNIISSYS